MSQDNIITVSPLQQDQIRQLVSSIESQILELREAIDSHHSKIRRIMLFSDT